MTPEYIKICATKVKKHFFKLSYSQLNAICAI
jgi:hypothetical protein